MRTKLWIGLTVLTLVVALPALAGGNCSDEKAAQTASAKGHACTADTQVCLNKMAGKLRNKGWVGVELEANETTGGYTITKVVAGSPAETAGLEKGDVLVAMNGIKIDYENEEAMKAAKKQMQVGSTVKYTVARNGEEKKVPVTLAAVPEHVMAEWIGRHMIDHVDVAKK